MSKVFTSLFNDLSELGVLVADTQDLLSQLPGDKLVEFQLTQLKHRQNEILSELKSLSLSERRQVLLYHFESPFESGVSISDMANSLNSLSNLLSSISTKHLSYSSPPELEFRAVVNQSFGLLFTSKQSEQIEVGDMIGDYNKSEQIINGLLMMTSELNNEDNIASVFHQKNWNKDTITAIKKFYDSICATGKTVSIEWVSPFQESQSKVVKITTERAKVISAFVKEKNVIPDETVALYGELGGISIYKKSIEFLQDGETTPITAKCPDDMLDTLPDLKIKHSYHITFKVRCSLDAPTETVKKTYYLKEIKE